jgi:hypothetical protein
VPRVPPRRPRRRASTCAPASTRSRASTRPGLDAALRRAAVALSAETFLDAIVVRLWERVGEGVHHGTLRPSHQHLAQAVLRRVLDRVTEAATLPGAGPDLLVATPPGQRRSSARCSPPPRRPPRGGAWSTSGRGCRPRTSPRRGAGARARRRR